MLTTRDLQVHYYNIVKRKYKLQTMQIIRFHLYLFIKANQCISAGSHTYANATCCYDESESGNKKAQFHLDYARFIIVETEEV